MLIYAILALLAVRLAWHIVCAVCYYRSAYYKCTRKHYLPVIRDAGKRGEYLLYKTLRGFERTGARFLFNVYIQQGNGHTTELDIIMIHSSGIYVFENKNYSGQIFGTADDQTWTQRIRQKNGHGFLKNDFLNPIRQNDLHIRCLKRTFPDAHPVHSVIVFGNRSELKNIRECINENFSLCHTRTVMETVTRLSLICGHVGAVEQDQVEQLYQAMYEYSQVADKVKRAHVANIQKKHRC